MGSEMCIRDSVWGGILAVIMGKATCHMHRAKVKGRKFFHNKCIN